MLLKANHNLVLPDGKTEIKVGETFEYNGDVRQFGKCVTIIGDEGKQPKPMTDDEVREMAKKLKISNYHTKGIEKLKKEIMDAQKAIDAVNAAKEADKDPEKDPKDPEKAPTNEGEKETTNGEAGNVGE